MILTHGLSAEDEVWISKSNVELRKAHQSRQNSTWEIDFQVDNSTCNVTWQYPSLAMSIAIADDVIMFTTTMLNYSKLVCLVVKKFRYRTNPAKNLIEALSGKGRGIL